MEHETQPAQAGANSRGPDQVVREFTAVDLEVKGRTVDVRVVPFGEVARVGDPPDFRPYDEEWLPGVFDHQLNAANRIHAKYGHSKSVVDVVGHGIQLRSGPDGYHVSTKIHQTLQGETALELLRDGALPCVSLEARPVKNVRTATGVVQRAKAHLTGFAFCQQGAFVGAQVLAIREQDGDGEAATTFDEAMLPVAIDPELIERCRQLGIRMPQRYQGHPDATDTPATAGTSESGTAHTEPSSH
jgi:HK97 family phage prohead protease